MRNPARGPRAANGAAPTLETGPAASLGSGGGPDESPAVAALRAGRQDGGRDAKNLRSTRQGTGRRLQNNAGPAVARSGQSQGQSAGRLSIHPRRGAAAVHFYERGRRAARRGNHSPRGRSRLSRVVDARRKSVRL